MSLKFIKKKHLGNILIDDSFDLNSVKVTDFGLSAMVSEYSSRFFTEQCGTPLYMAPELIQNKLYSKPVDVWSCGIIMFCIINKGKHPFQLFSKEKILEEIIKGEWTFSSCFTKLKIPHKNAFYNSYFFNKTKKA